MLVALHAGYTVSADPAPSKDIKPPWPVPFFAYWLMISIKKPLLPNLALVVLPSWSFWSFQWMPSWGRCIVNCISPCIERVPNRQIPPGLATCTYYFLTHKVCCCLTMAISWPSYRALGKEISLNSSSYGVSQHQSNSRGKTEPPGVVFPEMPIFWSGS